MIGSHYTLENHKMATAGVNKTDSVVVTSSPVNGTKEKVSFYSYCFESEYIYRHY